MATKQTKRGTSLAKGPVGLIGLVLLIYGITALILGSHSLTQHAPSGAVRGKTWLGLEVNGWSGLLFIVAGLLLLFVSPLHWGAKAMSLIVGIALGAAALVALAKGHGVLGIFAANGRTELVWGVAAALLIGLSLLPRVGGQATPIYYRDAGGAAGATGTRRRVVRESRTLEPVARETEGEGTRAMPARGAREEPARERADATGTAQREAPGGDGAPPSVQPAPDRAE